jgi:hypothetical protein
MKRLSIILILLVIQVLFLVPAIARGLDQDGGGTWRINTFPDDQQREFRHLMLGKVYHPERGIIYDRYVGSVDSSECSRHLAERKADAELQFTLLLSKVLEVVGKDTYAVSIAVSVCHPEWFVIYLHDGDYFASEEAYNGILKPSQ